MNNDNLFTNVSISCSNLKSLNGDFLRYLDEAKKYFNAIGNYRIFDNIQDKNNNKIKYLDNDSIACLIVWARELLNFKTFSKKGDNDSKAILNIIDEENNELFLQVINEIRYTFEFMFNKVKFNRKKYLKKIG